MTVIIGDLCREREHGTVNADGLSTVTGSNE